MEDDHKAHPTNRPLEKFLGWVGAYKLVKAVSALLLAALVLHMRRRTLPEIVSHWMDRLHIDPGSRFGRRLLARVLDFDPHVLRWVVVVLLIYAGFYVLEGVGLILKRKWAEWLTVITTCGLIPVEVYEVFRHFGWVKLAILVGNIAIVWYLVDVIQSQKRQDLQTNHTP